MHELLARPDLVYIEADDEELAHPISAVHIQQGYGRTILYSHGNAEDLGLCLKYLDRLAEICGADVLAYDYPGYGISEGSASEEGCYAAINAAYAHLQQTVHPSRIVAFGRSIGSGPTVDLVSRESEIRGMILQSPLESGARAVLGEKTSYWGYSLDIFKNYEKVEDIECPVLVMHGTEDEVVPIQNGRNIHAGCQNAVEPFWIEGRGHNNMPEQLCFQRIREFLDQLDGLWFPGFFQANACDMTTAL